MKNSENEIGEQRQCIRCGNCCDQGGPALHSDDMVLIRKCTIQIDRLYAIRAGERIRDNINGGFVYLDTELIKIRSYPESSRCLLYLPDKHACSIYDDRPAQCRAMKCWDTSVIVDMYSRDRLQRFDLFGKTPGLWDLIVSHEEKCNYGMIRDLVAKRSDGDKAAAKSINEILAYDQSLRDLVSSKMDVGPKLLDLIFGRPLKQTLPAQFGIRLKAG